MSPSDPVLRWGGLLIAALAATGCTPTSTALGAQAPYDLDEVEHFLISIGACEPIAWSPFGASPVLTTGTVDEALFDRAIVDVRYLDVPSVRACVARTHGDCDAVMACVGFGPATPVAGDGCGYVASCTGEVADVSCQDGFYLDATSTTPFSARYTQACATVGQTCSAGAGACVRPCTDGTWECAADGSSAHCAASSTTVDCPGGTTCVAGDGECVPTVSRACTSSICDGDVAWECVGGALARRFTCATAGMRCDVASGHCVAASSECTPDQSRCDGNVLTYCGPDGRVRRYDCTAHGWASCSGTFCVAHRPWLGSP